MAETVVGDLTTDQRWCSIDEDGRTLPAWCLRFIRRILGLRRGGRYVITLTLTTRPDWTIVEAGKIES